MRTTLVSHIQGEGYLSTNQISSKYDISEQALMHIPRIQTEGYLSTNQNEANTMLENKHLYLVSGRRDIDQSE